MSEMRLVWPAREHLPGYIAALEITLLDGTRVPRLPGYRRWNCLGHIGYAVVPWKMRRRYATQTLRETPRVRVRRAESLLLQKRLGS
jgi:hypothetical protein